MVFNWHTKKKTITTNIILNAGYFIISFIFNPNINGLVLSNVNFLVIPQYFQGNRLSLFFKHII